MISSILFEVITLFSRSKVIPRSIRTQLLQLLYIMVFSTVPPSFPGTGFVCLCSWAALMWCSCDLSSALGKELWETGLRWALPGPPPPRLGAAPRLRPQPWSPPEPRCCCPGPSLTQVRRLSIPAGLITVELLGTWILCWPLLQSWPLLLLHVCCGTQPCWWEHGLSCITSCTLILALAKLLTLLVPRQCRSSALSQQNTSLNCCI